MWLHDAQQRQHHRQDDSLLDPDQTTTTPAVMSASAYSPGLSRRMLASPRRSISLMAMTKTMEPSTQRGRILQRLGQKQQHQSDH